ncbi:MAG TPA: ShlB/FhaC/HecB family hemolysin secretion/activation protein [Candidatus Obscuribacterales bacterium]
MRAILLQFLGQQLFWQPRAIASRTKVLGLLVTALAVPSELRPDSAWASPASLAAVPGERGNLVAQSVPTPPAANPQLDPNQDRFLQPQPSLPIPTPTEEEPPILPTPTPETPPAQPDVTIPVKSIEVIGSTILGPREIDPIVQPYEGRSLTLEQLRAVADAITQLYLNQGYITSRAILVDQTITDGVVRVRVIEGSLERIEVEGNNRVNTRYIRDRIKLGAGTPLKKDDLEDQLRLLKTDPLFKNVEASLRAGEQLGQSVLTVRVTEANPFDFYLSADNYSPPSVGSERLGVSIVQRNLTGLGDQLAGAYYVSTTGGAELYDFSYRVPINAMNGTIQLRAAPNDYKITDPRFSALGIRGSSELYEISYRQPLVRSPREELALSLGFTFQDGQTFLFNDIPNPFVIGTGPNGISRTSVIKFGQDYVKRDPGGAWALRSQFNVGVDVLDATTNPDPIPDGRFFSWLGQAQRVQVLGTDNLLIAQLDLQLTPDSLLPSQQFVIGGGQSVRGFRQNARSGDNGVRFSLEDRIALQRNEAGLPILQLAPFFDLGAVWNDSRNPNEINNERFLAGAGVGLLWRPVAGLNVRLDYAFPLVDLSDRGQNAQDEAFYFSVVVRP